MNTLTMVTIAVIVILITGLIIPLRMSIRSKLIISLLLVGGMCRNYIYLVVGGTAYDPNIPYNLYFILEMTRSILITLAALVLIRVVINLVYKAIRVDYRAFIIPAHSLFYLMIMLSIATAISIYGTACTYRKPNLTHYQVKMDKLAPELDKLRIVVLSDMHISSQSNPSYVADIIARVNRLHPDLVLLPGDLIDGQVHKRHALAKLYFDLRAKYGVYFSSGNHEYYSDYTKWQNYLTQGGLISLDNKVAHIKDEHGKTILTLGGVTDPKAANYNLPMPDIAGVKAMLKSKAPTIVLSHRPAYGDDFSTGDNKADLVVSGHTHGGLMNIAAPIVSFLNNGFVSGHYKVNNTNVIVSRGINVWQGYPMRLGVPNEIVVISLRSKVKPSKGTISMTKASEVALKEREDKQKLEDAKAKLHATQVTANNAAIQSKPGTLILHGTRSDNVKTKSNELTKDKAEDSTRELNAYDESVMDSSIMRADGAATDLQIILPMVNIESGEISRKVTDLAVLPKNLTYDQKRRIIDILSEGTALAKLREQEEAKAKYDQLLEDKINILPMGYSLDVRESINSHRTPSQMQQEAPKQQDKNKHKASATQQQGDSFVKDEYIDETRLTSKLHQQVITDDETLFRLENESMSDVNDIAAEYGISIGTGNINQADHGVNDLIEKQQVQRNLPEDTSGASE